jgi:hypothetical protein
MHSWQRVRRNRKFAVPLTVRADPDYLPQDTFFIIDQLGNFLTDGAGNRLIVAE